MTDAFDVMDADLFEAFAEVATVVRGPADAVAVEVVVEEGVAHLGEFGQVIGRVTRAMFRAVQWRPESGDLLTVRGREREIVGIDEDDGRVVKAVLHG